MRAAINIEDALYLSREGQLFAITDWLDAEGNDCEPFESVKAIGEADGKWFLIDVAEFELEKPQ